jgi:hypothetical protein
MNNMRRIAFTSSTVVVVAMAIAFGQDKPDFSGTWTAVGEPGKHPTTMVVTQSAESMMLEVSQRGKDAVRYVFHLDSGDGKAPAPSNAAPGATTLVSRATWEGANLVLSTTPTSSGSGTRALKQTWSLVDGNLVITLSEINPATGAVLRETKQTFRKG